MKKLTFPLLILVAFSACAQPAHLEVAGRSGMLGRSLGCFAVSDSSLPEIIASLGPGRLIYADKNPA